MKILVVHEVSYKKKVVYEYQDFAERLAHLGHEVTVVDFDENGSGKPEEGLYSRTGLSSVWHISTPFVSLPILKYLTGRLNYKRILKRLISEKKVDAVLLYSVFINGTNTVRICKKQKIPVVYRVLDIYHKLRESSLIMLPLYLGERFIYRNADLICVTNSILEKYVIKLSAGRAENRVITLHHGVDLTFFKPKEKNKDLLAYHNIAVTDKVLVFIGTIYNFCGLDVIVNNFQTLLRSVPGLKLIIVGDGDLAPQLKELIKKQGLEEQVKITGFRPYNEVPEYISCADLTILPFYTNEITKDIVPIKVLQYLACQRPLLCTPLPEVKRLFPEIQSGVVYANIGQKDEFIEKIIEVLSNNGLQKTLGENALSFVKVHFDIEVQIKELQGLLNKVIGEQK